MSSLRSFLRTSSVTNDRGSDFHIPSSPSFGDFHMAFKAEHSSAVEYPDPAQYAGALSGNMLQRHSCDASMTSSTSSASSPKALLQRFSFDGATLARHSMSGATPQHNPLHAAPVPLPRQHRGAYTSASGEYIAEPVPQATGGSVQHSASMPIPTAHRASFSGTGSGEYYGEAGGTGTGPQRRKEGKIDGMDYYGWCELLRSSSL